MIGRSQIQHQRPLNIKPGSIGPIVVIRRGRRGQLVVIKRPQGYVAVLDRLKRHRRPEHGLLGFQFAPPRQQRVDLVSQRRHF